MNRYNVKYMWINLLDEIKVQGSYVYRANSKEDACECAAQEFYDPLFESYGWKFETHATLLKG